MRTVRELEPKGRVVVVRTDFDVPMSAEGTILDDYRIRAALPTITYLKDSGAKQIILISHLGRPVVRPREKFERIKAGNPRLSLEPVAWRLKELLGETSETLSTRQLGEFPLPAFIVTRGVYLVENIRFDWREAENDGVFGRSIAHLGDTFVYDAFAVAHRAHASTAGATKEAREPAAGLRLLQEVGSLAKLSIEINHPYVCVLGGSKVSTKLPVIDRLAPHVDTFLLGGVMANTFAKAQGMDTKRSTVELEQLNAAETLLRTHPSKFVLPEDYVWQNQKIMDIGPKTRERYIEILASAQMIFWNGTVGVTSLTAQDFKFGTQDIAKAIAANQQALTIVSGGDTVGTINEAEIDLAKYSFVSTGGGATLEFIAGLRLPALDALGYYRTTPDVPHVE